MSSRFMAWAWEEHGLPSAAKFVLIALSDQSNSDGFVDISTSKLRTMTGLGRDAVRYALAYLQERAYIVRLREKPEDIDTPDQFRINPDPPRGRAMQRRRGPQPDDTTEAVTAVMVSDE